MITEDQSEVVSFLASPATHGGAAVERIDSHASVVFLAGTRAWKLKRAVRYDYLDFSTAERRRVLCEAEVRINRTAAPAIYRGVVAVTREPDGSLALGGTGTPVDWLVEMTRFDGEGLFDRLAARGRLDLALMPALADAIARFHDAATRRPDHGGAAGMTWVVDGNATGFAEEGRPWLDAAACADLTARSRAAIERQRRLLDARRDGGFVRQCHGDLHLRNLVLVDGRPTLFDAVEFNDEISCTDVLYDLAFLLMDLWRRQLPGHANAVWNAYLTATGELDGLPLLPLFLSCRAAVRAKTSVTAAGLARDPRRGELAAQAREYLTLARQFLDPPPPVLVAIGGHSGTGKSTLARALAPALGAVPGAVLVRSDEIRKHLCGVDPLERLGREGYAPTVTAQVYATIADRARQAIAGGQAAVVDAVYADPGERASIERRAEAIGVPWVGLWLEAPTGITIARVERRHGDASDADAAVIRAQAARDVGVVGWHRLDASAAADVVLAAATAAVRDRLGAAAVRDACV
ncbi:MAG: AAA family ATPase [Vicinamibacterales bacterium]